MRLTRVYVDAALEPGTRLRLEGSAAGHVTRVLRLRVGEALTLFNGRGGEYAASVAESAGAEVTVAVGAHRAIERESPLPITLAQASPAPSAWTSWCRRRPSSASSSSPR